MKNLRQYIKECRERNETAKDSLLKGEFKVMEKGGMLWLTHDGIAFARIEDACAKALQNIPYEKRIARFVSEYPTLETIVKNKDLFRWHNTLTGSCEMGRRQFAGEYDIDVENGSMSVSHFIELTENSYGGDVIRKLKESYV